MGNEASRGIKPAFVAISVIAATSWTVQRSDGFLVVPTWKTNARWQGSSIALLSAKKTRQPNLHAALQCSDARFLQTALSVTQCMHKPAWWRSNSELYATAPAPSISGSSTDDTSSLVSTSATANGSKEITSSSSGRKPDTMGVTMGAECSELIGKTDETKKSRLFRKAKSRVTSIFGKVAAFFRKIGNFFIFWRNNTPFQDENPLGTAVTIKGTPIASSPLFGNAVPGSPPTTTGTPVISTATATSNKVLTPSALINNGQVAPQSKNLIQSTINNSDPSSPPGPRWAIAAKKVDLTGRWQIINSDEFREEYDLYLQSLGQPAIVRAIATTIVGFTREETIQDDSGRKFTIKGINPRGVWERTLLSSGTEVGQSMYEAVNATVVTADDEKVQAEAWWEDVGHVHKSWMHGIEKYGGGSFESARYLESRNVLVCKSYFHPNDKSRKTSTMTWRFQREGTK